MSTCPQRLVWPRLLTTECSDGGQVVLRVGRARVRSIPQGILLCSTRLDTFQPQKMYFYWIIYRLVLLVVFDYLLIGSIWWLVVLVVLVYLTISLSPWYAPPQVPNLSRTFTKNEKIFPKHISGVVWSLFYRLHMSWMLVCCLYIYPRQPISVKSRRKKHRTELLVICWYASVSAPRQINHRDQK